VPVGVIVVVLPIGTILILLGVFTRKKPIATT